MSEQEHQDLASFIKGVHHALRRESKKVGVERAWAEHCSQHDLLQRYAESMRRLATEFWDRESDGGGRSRIDWVAEKCLQYFAHGGAELEREKEKRQEKHLISRHNCGVEDRDDSRKPERNLQSSITSRLCLLDVGSCYNPFKDFQCFRVLPIDIAPASPEVLRCNFLDLEVTTPETSDLDWDTMSSSSSVNRLPGSSFHVVVFSLFLEYLPSPEHRYACCEKAHSLLRDEGLLFIVTPDIRQASRGSVLMKNWRVALAYAGFSRAYYEKLAHVQCMAYRKCPERSVPMLWAARQKVSGDDAKLIHIPQDFRDHDATADEFAPRFSENDEGRDEEKIVSLFTELPDCIS
ncbi:S-adenosylmethionine sensor upstream of mTORC1 [Bacillus rossius redtenbacheri]|uniref:S-adenosylmethionine sensor upstream of mTORC1 n=1 Tax=Bacillus rossius redtenbacheri TaxID=93214 RepID=UPI002FDE6936